MSESMEPDTKAAFREFQAAQKATWGKLSLCWQFGCLVVSIIAFPEAGWGLLMVVPMGLSVAGLGGLVLSMIGIRLDRNKRFAWGGLGLAVFLFIWAAGFLFLLFGHQR